MGASNRGLCGTLDFEALLFIASLASALRFAHLKSRYRAEISQFSESRAAWSGASFALNMLGFNAPSTYTAQ